MSESDSMFAMSNLLPNRTGLKYPIWYSAGIGDQKPGIKVDLKDGRSIWVSILDKIVTGDDDSISPDDLNDTFRWIDMNKELLLKYWDGAQKGIIDSVDVSEQILKLNN